VFSTGEGRTDEGFSHDSKFLIKKYKKSTNMISIQHSRKSRECRNICADWMQLVRTDLKIRLGRVGKTQESRGAEFTEHRSSPCVLPMRVRRILRPVLSSSSSAENRLANALVNGRNVKAYAEKHRLSVATARVHLRAVLTKTSTRRRMDLIQLSNSIPSGSSQMVSTDAQ